MGEAKRRRDKGLPPKLIKKKGKKENMSNIFQKFRNNQLLPIVLAIGFVFFLIFDLVRYYNQ